MAAAFIILLRQRPPLLLVTRVGEAGEHEVERHPRRGASEVKVG
jgi:hypothetical protein